MSKRVSAELRCGSCGSEFPVQLFRSIWIEVPENRALIFQDKINRFQCPRCRSEVKADFPFLATNVKKGIAIWYEPYADPQIDADVQAYKLHMGPQSFYALAPRLSDWAAFKTKIIELEALKPAPFNVPQPSDELTNGMRAFSQSLKKRPSSSAQKRTLALAILWCVLSIPLSDAVYDVWEYRHGASDLMRIFWLLVCMAPVWMFYGWRWLTDERPIGWKVWSSVLAFGSALALFLENGPMNRSWSDVSAIPLVMSGAFLVLAWSFDHRAMFGRRR